MPFGPPSLLREAVRSAATRTGGCSVSASGDQLVVTPQVDPGHGFTAVVDARHLECVVRLTPAQFGRDYAEELTSLLEGGTPLVLAHAVESFARAADDLTVETSPPLVELTLRPAAQDEQLTDLERLEELLTSLLLLATEPYVAETDASDITSGLGFRASVRREANGLSSPVFEYDPSERDRSTLEHRRTENRLIELLLQRGFRPFDGPPDLPFDLGWVTSSGHPCLVEVKSTIDSEREQLRLGLGQVLEYALRAEIATGASWAPILVASHELQDPIHQHLADRHGVHLVAGEPFDRILQSPDSWRQGEQ